MSSRDFSVENPLGSWQIMSWSRRTRWENDHPGGYADWVSVTPGQRATFLEECAQREQRWRDMQEETRRAERKVIERVFPPPATVLGAEERETLTRLMERDRSLLKRSALVIYRCGVKRPNGKVRGCLLGAVVNLKGDRYWIHQQRAEPEEVHDFEVTAYLDGEHRGWGEYTSQILDETVGDDGHTFSWMPENLREAADVGLITGGSLSLNLEMRPAHMLTYWDDYRTAGMNCPHTDARRGPIEIVRDVERLERGKDKTIYLTTEGDARYLENKNAVRNDELMHLFEHSENPDP